MVIGRTHAAISTIFFFLASSATLHAQLFLEKGYEDNDDQKENVTCADTDKATSDDALIRDLLDYADQYVGKRYRSGATGPHAFDCSGYTSFVFKRFGYELPHSSAGQSYVGDPVEPGDWRPGDLVFFNGYRVGGTRVGHVGIVTRNNGDTTFQFIHSSTSQGVRYDRSDDRYYDIRYVTARRVIGNATTSVVGDNGRKKNTSVRSTRYETIQTQTTYDVRKGDNLYSIARRNDCSVRDLKEWNGLKGNHLSIGQSLIIKKTERHTVTTKKDDALPLDTTTNDINDKVKADEKTPLFHTVEKGETLFSISVHYSVPVNEIRRLNDLNDNTIKIGQRLLLTSPEKDPDTQPTEP